MSDQAELFPAAPRVSDDAPATDAPLSTRMRPRTLDDYVGQRAVVGAESVLRRALEADRLPSLILWGPPGSGKTTLATIIASMTSSTFEPISATSAGVADLRKVVERARERQRTGVKTLLFVDEIHRFNKNQQDAILPHVESGIFTLLGATTENPSFEVNSALLSRARVVRLERLEAEDLTVLIRRALADSERGLGTLDVQLGDDAIERLISGSGGDARVALDALGLAAAAASGDNESISVADIEGALQQPALLYDRGGDQHYWVVSAFIKSLRGSDPDASIYWLVRMLEAGEDPVFVARRLVILAAEDVGLANPHALAVAVAAQQAAHSIGMPEAYLPLAEATLYLALAPKSNSAMRAYNAARDDVRATLHQPVPLHLRNAVTGLNRSFGFGAGYRNAHDDPATVGVQQFLPDELVGHTYYQPGAAGAEPRLAQEMIGRRGQSE